MKKKILYVFIMVVFIFGFYFIDNQNDVVVDDEYWKSVHYFANGWQVNMWDSEFETVDRIHHLNIHSKYTRHTLENQHINKTLHFFLHNFGLYAQHPKSLPSK